MKIGDQDKSWAPYVICGTCQSNLDGWLRGDRHSMLFAIPRIWREPQNHIDDCYFCMVDISRFRKTKNHMTLHILPYHLLLHLFHIAVSCHCPNHRAIKLQKIQQCLKMWKKILMKNSTYLIQKEIQNHTFQANKN